MSYLMSEAILGGPGKAIFASESLLQIDSLKKAILPSRLKTAATTFIALLPYLLLFNYYKKELYIFILMSKVRN